MTAGEARVMRAIFSKVRVFARMPQGCGLFFARHLNLPIVNASACQQTMMQS
jgi:hypothetical protein